MTVAEFLNWNPEDPQRWQLFDGEPRATAPSSRSDGALLAELARLICNRLIARGSSCTVVTEPGVAAELLRRHPDGSLPERPITLVDGDLVLESIDMRVALAHLYVTTRLARR